MEKENREEKYESMGARMKKNLRIARCELTCCLCSKMRILQYIKRLPPGSLFMCTINIGTDVDTRLYRAYSWDKRERACSSILPGTRRTIFSSLVATDRGGMPA